MSETPTLSAQTWNTTQYAANGRFVATLATDIVAMLNPQPGEHILDLGCGDGALTAQLAASGAILTGVDSSSAMVAAARARAASDVHGFDVDQASITNLPYHQQFDAVFSNAALHWLPLTSQPAALAAIHRSLRPGGRFIAEMGGQGNIAAIRTALSAVLQPHRLDSEQLAASFFPSPSHFQHLLEQAGFHVHSISLHPRPTPLPNGPEGMTSWLNTFRNGVLDYLPPTDRLNAVSKVVALLTPILQDPRTHNWTADYVRLRFHATRTQS